MKETISAAEMQALEAEAFRSGRLSSRDAMETAGHGVAQAVVDLFTAENHRRHVLVLCGPGNNGGDGYVVARLLHDKGWSVEVYALGRPGDSAPDAAANRALWLERGPVQSLTNGGAETTFGASSPDVIVDALFGIGLTRGITGPLAIRLSEVERHWPLGAVPRVAVDLPSGLDADTGKPLGAVLPATLSATFHMPKPAHLISPEICGRVELVDIGL